MANDPTVVEYKDLSDNMRHYGNMRFAQLTIFVAITGGLLAVISNEKSALLPIHKTILKVVGLCIAVTFWIMEERAADYWHHFRKRAEMLEESLGYEQYRGRPEKRLLTATNATRTIFVGIIVLWLIFSCFP